MSKHAADISSAVAPALADDVGRVLGTVDSDKVGAITALRPTIADAEEASSWVAGDADVFGAGGPLKPVAGRIVDILTADEDQEPRRRPRAERRAIIQARKSAGLIARTRRYHSRRLAQGMASSADSVPVLGQ